VGPRNEAKHEQRARPHALTRARRGRTNASPEEDNTCISGSAWQQASCRSTAPTKQATVPVSNTLTTAEKKQSEQKARAPRPKTNPITMLEGGAKRGDRPRRDSSAKHDSTSSSTKCRSMANRNRGETAQQGSANAGAHHTVNYNGIQNRGARGQRPKAAQS
jgi:hypothetical protein